MGIESLLASDAYVDYPIIGAQVLIWVILLLARLLGIPLSQLASINPAAAIIVAPFAIAIGIVFDSLTSFLLKPWRSRIRRRMSEGSGEEAYIAAHSASLYSAYELRSRRTRIPGASIFNMPLLAIAILLNIGTADSSRTTVIAGGAILLSVAFAITWERTTVLAYRFRRYAVEVVQASDAQPLDLIKNKPHL